MANKKTNWFVEKFCGSWKLWNYGTWKTWHMNHYFNFLQTKTYLEMMKYIVKYQCIGASLVGISESIHFYGYFRIQLSCLWIFHTCRPFINARILLWWKRINIFRSNMFKTGISCYTGNFLLEFNLETILNCLPDEKVEIGYMIWNCC